MDNGFHPRDEKDFIERKPSVKYKK
jgi:hypothetical protein